jgi:hypothetical protein
LPRIQLELPLSAWREAGRGTLGRESEDEDEYSNARTLPPYGRPEIFHTRFSLPWRPQRRALGTAVWVPTARAKQPLRIIVHTRAGW